MSLFRENRIWKKMNAWGMAFFMTGMVLGGVSAHAVVYAADIAYEETYTSEESISKSSTLESMERTEKEQQTETEAETLEDKETEDGETITEDWAEDAGIEKEISEESELSEASDDSLDDGVNDNAKENEEDRENAKKKAGFTITVETDEDQIKAGRDLVYTVTLENTGDVMLKNIRLDSQFSQEALHGEWSEELPDQLDAGMREEFYLTVKLPEELDQTVSLQLQASVESETDENAEADPIVKKISIDTKIIPLKASFEVTKTADRSVAVPGDQIMFQICIRNTGERTLHSVITTERFQMGKIPVQFLEKEGVVLNKSKTKARIEKIEPGKAAGLQAMITLPEDVEAQDLLNEVVVTTLETGEREVTSQARVQIKAAEKTDENSEEEVKENTVDTESGAVSHTGESYPTSTHPKTGDPYQPFLWLAMIPGSLLTAGWIRSRM